MSKFIEAQRALYRLWYTHYTRPITQEERNALATEFTEKWLDDFLKVDLYNPIYRHPMTWKKTQARVTIAEVLADFVLHADMDDERAAEYPVTHAEQELTNADARRTNKVRGSKKWAAGEFHLFSGEVDAEAGERVPSGYIAEDDAATRRAYQPADPVTVEQLRRELAHVKKYAEFYATSFAQEYGKNRAEVLRRINRMRLERIRECEICGGGFFAWDLRRRNCDQQHGVKSGGGVSDSSACELLYQSIYHAEYYARSREKRPS